MAAMPRVDPGVGAVDFYPSGRERVASVPGAAKDDDGWLSQRTLAAMSEEGE